MAELRDVQTDWDPENPAMLADVQAALADLRARCPVAQAAHDAGAKGQAHGK